MILFSLNWRLNFYYIRTIFFYLDMADLRTKENGLDKLIANCTRQLRTLTEDSENARLAYVTYQDIRGLDSLKEQTVIAIKAPPETRLEVPDPDKVSFCCRLDHDLSEFINYFILIHS